MAVLLGGRASEKIVFQHLSTGAADDLAKVTDIARAMVTRYGMSEKLGHVALETERHSFLGPTSADTFHPEHEYGEQTAAIVDAEVRALTQSAFERSLGILKLHQTLLDQGARQLLEKETLSEAELLPIARSVSAAASKIDVQERQ
jgi:cell division protease FtsH